MVGVTTKVLSAAGEVDLEREAQTEVQKEFVEWSSRGKHQACR